MTDRYKTITVLLEEDTCDDDALPIIDAIKMIKGVLTAKGNVTDPEDWAARNRIKGKIWEVFHE